MLVVNDNNAPKPTGKAEIEQLQLKQHEYKIIGSFQLTRGLRLFSYNTITQQISEVVVRRGDTVHLIYKDGRFTWEDKESAKSMHDPRCIYFECLNAKSAAERLRKWESGRIKSLFNLKEPSKNTIKFY